MFTQTRRPLSEQEIAPYRLKLAEATSNLGHAKQSAKRAGPVLVVTCLALVALAIIGYLIVSVVLVAVGLASLPIALYYLLAPFFHKSNNKWSYEEMQRGNLQALVDRGEFVETRVTSSRCFVVLAFDDESDECYFDLGEQGTLVIWDFGMRSGWTPNTDFTLSHLEAPTGNCFNEKVRSVGQRLEPAEVISRRELTESDYEHLQVIPGSFEELLQKMRLLGER